MADVLTVVAKVRAAKGKGDALAALLKEQVAAVRKAALAFLSEPGAMVKYEYVTDRVNTLKAVTSLD